jgi:hypothetical protein
LRTYHIERKNTYGYKIEKYHDDGNLSYHIEKREKERKFINGKLNWIYDFFFSSLQGVNFFSRIALWIKIINM